MEDVDMSESPSPQPAAHGLRQFHTFTITGTVFEVDTRYVNLRAVGQGSYGLVCSADDTQTQSKVAIKKVTDMFADLIDAKRILREIRLLRHLGDHENIVGLVDVCTMPPHTRDFRDVYIITELFECDLDRIVMSNQQLSDQHAQYFLYQILRGIKFVHSANVLHRDLKPSNLLVNSNCDLSICDFGLGRGVNQEYEDTLTEYVVTRWYRAPELLTDSRHYGTGVDVWSIGCIFAEILARRPILQGRDPMHQLQLIIELVGSPAPEEMAFVTNATARRAIESRGRHRRRPLARLALFQGCSPLALDLLQRMLVFDPSRRISVDEALRHPYLAELHDETEVPVARAHFDLDFEEGYRGEMPRQLMQQLIWDDMCAFHPEERAVGARIDQQERQMQRQQQQRLFQQQQQQQQQQGGDFSARSDSSRSSGASAAAPLYSNNVPSNVFQGGEHARAGRQRHPGATHK